MSLSVDVNCLGIVEIEVWLDPKETAMLTAAIDRDLLHDVNSDWNNSVGIEKEGDMIRCLRITLISREADRLMDEVEAENEVKQKLSKNLKST